MESKTARFVLVSRETGKPIALDSASGGYPYDVDDLWQAKFFATPEDAIRYTAVSSWKDYDHPVYDLYEISILTSPRYMPTGSDLSDYRK